MSKPVKPVNLIFYAGLVALDLLLYMILGLLFIGYEDQYDPAKGPYMSLQSMDRAELIVYLLLNCWYAVNIGLLLFVVFKISRHIRRILRPKK